MAKQIKDYSQVYERLKKQSKRGGGGSDRSYIELEEGDNQVRILPGHPKMDGFFVEVFYHNRNLRKESVRVRCLNNGDMDGDDCPICEELKELRRSKDKGDKKIVSEHRPKSRFFMNAIDRSDKTPEVKVLACGTSIMTALLGYMTDPEYGDFTDVSEGLDIVIGRSGTGLDTEYTVKPRRKSTPLFKDSDEVDALIGTGSKDTKLLPLHENAEQFEGEPDNAMFVWENGWEAFKKKMEEEAEDEDESSKKSKKSSKKPREEEEEEDEEEERPKSKKPSKRPKDEEEEEEEEPKPKKKKPAPREEDEEEDEEPKPKKKKVALPPPDEDDEEEDEPKVKPKKKAPPKEEDDEEEEEQPKKKAKKPQPKDEDEEDDDPPPVKKKAKKPAADDEDDDDLAALDQALDQARSKKRK